MKTNKAIVKETSKVAAPKVETAPVKKAAPKAASKTVVTAEEKKTVKETPQKEALKAAEAPKKEAAKAVEAPKAAAAPEKKAPAKKPAAKKPAIKETVYLQYLGKEIDNQDIIKKVKDVWTKELKNKIADIKSITLYLKPEENAAYYVINDDVTGSVSL